MNYALLKFLDVNRVSVFAINVFQKVEFDRPGERSPE